jgi:hypothetical protein
MVRNVGKIAFMVRSCSHFKNERSTVVLRIFYFKIREIFFYENTHSYMHLKSIFALIYFHAKFYFKDRNKEYNDYYFYILLGDDI